MPRSCRRSSTWRNDSGHRMYIITVRRITSGELLKFRNGLRICRRYEMSPTRSSVFALTPPNRAWYSAAGPYRRSTHQELRTADRLVGARGDVRSKFRDLTTLESEPTKLVTETKPQMAAGFSPHWVSPVRPANSVGDQCRGTQVNFGQSREIKKKYFKTMI